MFLLAECVLYREDHWSDVAWTMWLESVGNTVGTTYNFLLYIAI